TLVVAAIELLPIAVQATSDPNLNPSRTGPAEIISVERISALPNPRRDFLTVTTLSPHVAISPGSNRARSGGITIGGENRLLNSFQIDGGLSHDPYTGQLPGRGTLPRPVALEALKEIQVLVAPFDVRHGGFAGGLVNGVTKSGTNAVHGSLFGYLAAGALVGKHVGGDPVEPFMTWQYGGTVGGPIVRDRAHYFLSVDVQRRVMPDPGPLITDTVGGADTLTTGIRYTDATRFQDILRNAYGLDPGTLGPSHGRVPAIDVFGKVTVQVGANSHFEFSHQYTDGDSWGFIARQFGTYFLSSFDRKDFATSRASRFIWTSLVAGRWSNQLIASLLRLRDRCRPKASYPFIRVSTAAQRQLVAGTPQICPSSFTQDAFEETENLTTGSGPHVLTLGMHFELLSFEEGQLLGGAELWEFRNLDSLEAGRAFHYERTLPGPARTGIVKFRARQIGLYAQDRWQPTRLLTVTTGLRLDVPLLPDPVVENAALAAALGVDNGRLPSGRLLWSPRLGANYDLGGAGRTFLRSGIGIFSARPPYTWVMSAYRDDGTQQLFITCDGAAVPPFDPVNQPTACANGAGATPRLSFFDPDVTFPQSLKASVGVDHRLPGGVVGTLDVLYTRARRQWYFSDANLLGPVGVAHGEGGRPLYGTMSASGVATPTRRAASLGQVVRVSDRSGDRSVTVSVRLRRQFADRAWVSVLYAHSRARDRMSLVNFQARPNLENTVAEGTLDDRRLGKSYFEIPHRVVGDAAVRLPHGIRLSLLYAGASGVPYTYTVAGDANGDGIGTGTMQNDAVYVPRDRADIALDGNGSVPGLGTVAEQDSVYALLDRFIRAEPCLHAQRGRLMARNSCRNPLFGTLHARVTKDIPTVAGQSLELTADVYNVLNLLNRRWGRSRLNALNPPVQPLLRLVGYDASAGRGIYRPQIPALGQIQDLASRWQVELSVRYAF
ncbi:MAG TPA: hypothetical protein VGQ48_02405, partial [Gemmatimonadales bacterium]|nr:hypothetical protein [Gemmatimonadales bacterium]